MERKWLGGTKKGRRGRRKQDSGWGGKSLERRRTGTRMGRWKMRTGFPTNPQRPLCWLCFYLRMWGHCSGEKRRRTEWLKLRKRAGKNRNSGLRAEIQWNKIHTPWKFCLILFYRVWVSLLRNTESFLTWSCFFLPYPPNIIREQFLCVCYSSYHIACTFLHSSSSSQTYSKLSLRGHLLIVLSFHFF